MLINCPNHHVDFEALDGCPQCIAERRADEEVNSEENIAKAIDEVQPKSGKPIMEQEIPTVFNIIVKVRYFSGTTREYSYFSEEPLAVGDKVNVPLSGRKQKAIVTAIDVPESEIAAFRDRVLTIPVGSKLIDQGPEEDTAKLASAKERAPHIVEDTEQFLKGGNSKVHLCDSCTKRKDYPVCCPPGTALEFGNGKGNDNIIQCGKYANGPAAPCSVPLGVENQPEQSVEQEPLSDEEEARIMAEGPGESIAELAMVGFPLPDNDEAVKSLVVQAQGYLHYAQTRVVNDVESAKTAAGDLALIANTKKAIEAKRKEYLDPVNAKAAEIRDFFKELQEPIQEADVITRRKVLDYNAEVERQRVEAERLENESLQLAKDQEALTGEHTVSLEPIDKPAATPQKIRTAVGTTSKSGTWKYKVVNFALLSDEFKIEDSAVLTARARKHHDKKPLPGIEFYFEPGLTVRASK